MACRQRKTTSCTLQRTLSKPPSRLERRPQTHQRRRRRLRQHIHRWQRGIGLDMAEEVERKARSRAPFSPRLQLRDRLSHPP